MKNQTLETAWRVVAWTHDKETSATQQPQNTLRRPPLRPMHTTSQQSHPRSQSNHQQQIRQMIDYQDHPTLDFTIECPHCWLENGHLFDCPNRTKTPKELKCS
jgi:hypothetical protein